MADQLAANAGDLRVIGFSFSCGAQRARQRIRTQMSPRLTPRGKTRTALSKHIHEGGGVTLGVIKMRRGIALAGPPPCAIKIQKGLALHAHHPAESLPEGRNIWKSQTT